MNSEACFREGERGEENVRVQNQNLEMFQFLIFRWQRFISFLTPSLPRFPVWYSEEWDSLGKAKSGQLISWWNFSDNETRKKTEREGEKKKKRKWGKDVHEDVKEKVGRTFLSVRLIARRERERWRMREEAIAEFCLQSKKERNEGKENSEWIDGSSWLFFFPFRLINVCLKRENKELHFWQSKSWMILISIQKNSEREIKNSYYSPIPALIILSASPSQETRIYFSFVTVTSFCFW